MPTRTGPITLASVASVASPLAMPTRRSACSATMVTLARPAAPSAALRCQTSSANFSSRACVEPKAVGASASACNRNARNRSPSSTLIRRTCQSRDTSRSSSFTGQLRSGGETFRLAARQRQQFSKILGANRQGAAATTDCVAWRLCRDWRRCHSPRPASHHKAARIGGRRKPAGRAPLSALGASIKALPSSEIFGGSLQTLGRAGAFRSAAPAPGLAAVVGRRATEGAVGALARAAHGERRLAAPSRTGLAVIDEGHSRRKRHRQVTCSRPWAWLASPIGVPHRVGRMRRQQPCPSSPPAIRGRAAKVWIDAICRGSAGAAASPHDVLARRPQQGRRAPAPINGQDRLAWCYSA